MKSKLQPLPEALIKRPAVAVMIDVIARNLPRPFPFSVRTARIGKAMLAANSVLRDQSSPLIRGTPLNHIWVNVISPSSGQSGGADPKIVALKATTARTAQCSGKIRRIRRPR